MATQFLCRYRFFANIYVRRAFRAYKAKQYESMFYSLRYVKPQNFVNNKEEDMTILHHAAYVGDLECIDTLKDLPYFPEIINDSTNEYEWTPVLWATTKKHYLMMKKLHKLGANILKPKKDGITCMHLAATNNDIHILDYLLQNRPTKSVDLENNEGWTPAHFAAFMNNYDSLNLLIENGADLWHKNQQKMNVFEEIVRSNDDNLLQCVYEIYKTKPRDLSIEGGFSLLHLAAGSDAFKALKFLIQEGESVRQICNEKDRATPLHFAALSNNFNCAKMLLSAGASPNAKDSTGNTPYHFAVSSKNRRMIQLMEESGGNALIENDNGISALDHAGLDNIRSAKLYFLGIPKYKKVLKDSAYI